MTAKHGTPIEWTHWPGRLVPIEAFYELRDQCAAAGVPFFMKQAPRKAEIPADLLVRQFPQLPGG